MALISKEDLLTKFETGALLFQPEVKRIIKTQPEVDAVPVVRCKDCKHRVYTDDGESNPDDIVCDLWESDGFTEADYCSRGERRITEDPSHPCADSVMMGE